jgi:hypothetical protein
MTGRYGGQHQAVRRAMLPYAVGSPCARCGRVIGSGQLVDLDHADDGVTYLGWSHPHCNRAAGARLGNARRRQLRAARQERILRMLNKCALGIEISEARDHVSIAAAGFIDGDFVMVELAAYVDGTDPTEAVLWLRDERTVSAVVLDPRSPAATAVRPLRHAGVPLTELSTHDVAVAHGEFLDSLAAGRLRHAGQAELTTAIRYGQQRRLGGATAWERRGAPVDVSPAVAAELALWALVHASAQTAIY